MNLLSPNGLPIARIRGIEVRVHLSWVIVLALVTLAVASELQTGEPTWTEPLRWGVAAGISVLFFVSVLVHELSHALVARRRGLSAGSVTLMFFGGATIVGQEAQRPADEAIVAASGPIASGLLGLAFLAAWLVAGAVGTGPAEVIAQVGALVGLLNLLLAGLNILPVYPLDGGRVMRAIFWQLTGSPTRASRGAAILSRISGYGLVVAGIVATFSDDALDGIMLVIIGWFVGGSARTIERRAALEDLLRGLRVDAVMERGLPAVAPYLTLDTFAAQYLASGEGTSLPVMRDDRLLGLIGISQLRRIRRAAWPTTHASDVMISPPTLPMLGPDDELWPALERLRNTGLDGLPVVRDSELLGVLTRRGVVSVIQARMRPLAGAAPGAAR